MEYKIDRPQRDSEVHPIEGSAHQPLVSDAPLSYSIIRDSIIYVIRDRDAKSPHPQLTPPPGWGDKIRELEKKDRAALNVVSIQPMANSQV